MTTVDVTQLSSLLDGHSYVQVYQELLNEVQEGLVKKTSVAQRAEEWQNALATLNEDRLLEMQETMSNFVDLVSKHEVDLSFDQFPKSFTDTQKIQLMQGALATKDIREFLDVYYNWIRSAVFSVITEQAEQDGRDNPEYVKGEIVVSSLKKRFCKEGGGRKDPILDEEKLKSLLSEEDYKSCIEIETIPARTVETFSIEKLMGLVKDDPSVLEKIRESLIPGGFKSNSFTIRDAK